MGKSTKASIIPGASGVFLLYRAFHFFGRICCLFAAFTYMKQRSVRAPSREDRYCLLRGDEHATLFWFCQ